MNAHKNDGAHPMRPLIAGNWKMNGMSSQLAEIETIAAAVKVSSAAADVLICPPSTLIARAAEIAGGRIAIGGQDCHHEIAGAFTGRISAGMLKEAGAAAVIVGHSECRRDHHETDATIAAKVTAARRVGLQVIVCIGETAKQRQDGLSLTVCGNQIASSLPHDMTLSAAERPSAGHPSHHAVAIAHEPLWAIGTGRTPIAEEIIEVHRHIRRCVVERFGAEGHHIRILYGGSVKPANARAILALPDVDGALVGGASLQADEFDAIIKAVPTRP